MRHLFAWDNDSLIGRFDEQAGQVAFAYEPDADYPISLSLPLDGRWPQSAPAAFLDGLLPETKSQRLQMMASTGAASTDAFDLLDSVDSTGGLVFTTHDSTPSLVASAAIATPADIEAQMQRIYDAADAWWDAGGRNRFSLAGNQGKFSLARINGMWFWPNATLPSTHIIKPDGRRITDVSLVECSTMEIARQVGVPTAWVSVICLGMRRGLLVERFDRVYDVQAMTIRRLRAEDLTQAMGEWGRDKYDFELPQIIGCLREAGVDSEVLYGLVRQVAFNACVGNHDAHAKNYSVIIEKDGVRVAPLYDAISMAHWPQYKNDVLAMPVNGIYDPWEVTYDDWRKEAAACGLDADRVEGIVAETVDALQGVDYDALDCGTKIAREIEGYVQECCRDLLDGVRGNR